MPGRSPAAKVVAAAPGQGTTRRPEIIGVHD